MKTNGGFYQNIMQHVPQKRNDQAYTVWKPSLSRKVTEGSLATEMCPHEILRQYSANVNCTVRSIYVYIIIMFVCLSALNNN